MTRVVTGGRQRRRSVDAEPSSVPANWMQMGTGLTLKIAGFLSGDDGCYLAANCYDTDEIKAICLCHRHTAQPALTFAP
jgi:hypothetical protein